MKIISFLFFSIMFVIGTDTFLISPLLPTLTSLYEVSTDVSGFMVSAYALGYAVFAFLAGPLSDRLDRKKVMLMGFIGFIISTFLCGVAPSFSFMLLFRFAAGVSAAFITPQVWASIPVLVQPQHIVKTMGFATAGLAISQLIGIPIGSYLAHISWHMPFYFLSFLALILLIVIQLVYPSLPPVKQNESASFWKPYKTLFMAVNAKSYILAYFIFQVGNFAAFSFIGSWLSQDFYLDVASVGTAMMAIGLGNAIGSLFGSHLIQKMGQSRSLLLSFILFIGLYGILPLSTNLLTAEIILAVAFLVAGFVFPVFMSLFQSLTTSARGTISSVSNAAMYIGTTVGSMTGGVLFARFDGFWGVSIFAVGMFILSLLIYSKTGVFKRQEAVIPNEA